MRSSLKQFDQKNLTTSSKLSHSRKKPYYFYFFDKISTFFTSCCKRKRNITVNKIADMPLNNVKMIQTTKNEKKFIDFIKLLMIILRVIRNLKWQTSSMRTLDFVRSKEILFVNDVSSFLGLNSESKEEYSFIKNKFIRLKLIYLKKKLKKILWISGFHIIFFIYNHELIN